MFTKVGPNAVESDAGFSVRRTGRFSLEYREGDRVLDVEVEPGEGLAIYGSSIQHWLPPHDRDSIGSEERASILTNISQALDSLGSRHLIVD